MLTHLRVRNLGILEDAAIDPSAGFTVITGETGTGKTLLLGGLRLILGDRVAGASVGAYDDVAQADGLFLDGDEEIGVTRSVPREGHSRAFVDGAISSAQRLRERIGSLVEIVGQHEQLTLQRSSVLLSAIDGVLTAGGDPAPAEFDRAWRALQDVRERQRMIGGDHRALARELDLSRYQASEIEGAHLSPEDATRLANETARLRNIEEIRHHLAESLALTDGIREDTGQLVSGLRKVVELDPEISDLAGQAEDLAVLLEDMARGLRDHAVRLEPDPERLSELEERLNVIGDLKRKYGRTIEEVVEFGREAAARAEELERSLAEAEAIEGKLDEALESAAHMARNLHDARSRAAADISAVARRHLAAIGLGSAFLELRLEPVELGPSGMDRAELWFSSDARLKAAPVGDLASGGELSRLVLAFRLATANPQTRTIVFDEVDTGVGGVTALGLGRKLRELSKTTQVLCVTHLPQVAAHADAHYVVTRAESKARVTRVDGDLRVHEISRMLAGIPDSDAGRETATELLDRAQAG